MGYAHRAFQKDLARLLAAGADAASVDAVCNAYLETAAATFRDHVLAEGGFQVKVGQMISGQKALLPPQVTETLVKSARAFPFFGGGSLKKSPMI